VRIDVNRSVSEANDAIAEKIVHSLSGKMILCINVMGAPGSGKTTVLEAIVPQIGAARIAVIQGDLESDIDKKRMEALDVPTYQINTHSGCHLNAVQIEDAIRELDLEGRRFLFIENVGNLVCPANKRIGQHLNIVVSSTAEGSDKPRKYPIIFKDADAVVVSKHDLSTAVGFDESTYLIDIQKMNPHAKLVKTSSKDSSSFRALAKWLEHEWKRFYSQARPAQG
jgi:hydrogenase nickel incorporation protein HypB